MNLHVWMTMGLLLAACNGDKGDDDDDGVVGGTTDNDARLISDVYVWECVDIATKKEIAKGESDVYFLGVFSQVVSLEYAPNALLSMELPGPGGCSSGVDMFPISAGSGGSSLPALDGYPEWSTAEDRGILLEESTGFWVDNVRDNVHSCDSVDTVLSGGTQLTNAGSLTGITTPEPVDVPMVDFDGMSFNKETEVYSFDWGDEVTASWDDHEWDEVWVQIRREREGEAWEAVNCNVTGESAFTIDSTIWDLMDPDLQVERNNIYVAFQRTGEELTQDGILVKTATRAMAVGVIQD